LLFQKQLQIRGSEAAFSMAALRIRRRLAAGLNGQDGQMFVVVNKFCCASRRRGPVGRGYGKAYHMSQDG
jgi:hypothetical protein